jgi:hypothetical protein
VILKQSGTSLNQVDRGPPKASVETIADFETFLSVSLFCFGGLLVSVSVIVADKYMPGEWF